MQENYLAKWLSGELSKEELEEFKNSDAYASYERLRAGAASLSGPDFNVDKALERLNAEHIGQAPKVISLNPFKKFLRVAAVIAILLAGSYFYLSGLNESVSTEYAQRTEVTLPDDSEIFLNADSEVSFSQKNWNENRNVILQGEAFFKVAKGQKFTVTTNQGQVAVLGTQFNVESRENFFEVTCYEGLVSVTHNGKETQLPAGNSFMIINGAQLNASKPKTNQPTWLDSESSFENIPLKYVLSELERQYDLKVKTENVNVDLRFTGTFSNKDLDMALKSISSPSKLRYNLEGNKVLFYAESTPQ
ncbi:FecR family protein [Flagellimonas meishanensis]|uniref:FecR family protein n=1 Tax=Flagellimonas meishanensis TaxID=2873264 RepID=UPI001CA71B9E|nr:FecR domain-containing protein [[Muricauda] meishanensis]